MRHLPADCIGADRQFEFHKHRQLLIGAHNETLSAVAMRVKRDMLPFM
jgi:hypothetical protein